MRILKVLWLTLEACVAGSAIYFGIVNPLVLIVVFVVYVAAFRLALRLI